MVKDKAKKAVKEKNVVEVELTEAEAKALAEKEASPMNPLLQGTAIPPKVGDSVEGPVVNIDHGRIYIDIFPIGTAVIYGREYLSARDVLKNVHIGDVISAKVIETENEDGYIEVSLREARQAQIWNEAESALQKKTLLELPIKDANKGGLIIEWQGIIGFLPASQLSQEHYPRVQDGDKDKIYVELKKMIGTKVNVCIINADPKEGKLIFSEKVPGSAGSGSSSTPATNASGKALADAYAIGDVLDGTVSGSTDFGIFVTVAPGLEGLVHISEMDWGLVENPKEKYRVGDAVKVKVIDIKDGKISLSIKALKENPWVSASNKYKKGDNVQAVIIKYNQYGALASIEEGVAGLVHFSEFKDLNTLRSTLKLGSVYPFAITVFDPEARKMTLSFSGKKAE
jgi:small subunit ribosomal protein S1